MGNCVRSTRRLGPRVSRQRRVEPDRGLGLERRRDVAVGVERHRHGGVAEPLLHHLRVDALAEQQRCVRVPQVVEPGAREPGLVAPERGDRDLGQDHQPPRPGGLELAEHGPALVPLQQLAADREGARLEVDVAPLEAEQLALTEARRDREDEQRLQRVAPVLPSIDYSAAALTFPGADRRHGRRRSVLLGRINTYRTPRRSSSKVRCPFDGFSAWVRGANGSYSTSCLAKTFGSEVG